MFSYLISSIANTLAPERNLTLEFHSLLRNGDFDSALSLLRSSGKEIDVHQVGSMGLAPIHFACGAGHLELLVELLSLGVDVCSPSTTKNHPLHYACANNCKGVVSLLLRSGADASFPNASGKIAAELATDPEIRTMLLSAHEYPVTHHKSDEYVCAESHAVEASEEHNSPAMSTTPADLDEGTPFHTAVMDGQEVSAGAQEFSTDSSESTFIAADVPSDAGTDSYLVTSDNQPSAAIDSQNTMIHTSPALVDIAAVSIPPPPLPSPEPPRPHDRPKISPAPIKPPVEAPERTSDVSESDLVLSDSDSGIVPTHPVVITRAECDAVSSLFLPSPSAPKNEATKSKTKQQMKRRYSLPPGHPSVELPQSPVVASYRVSAKTKDTFSLPNSQSPVSEEKRIGKRRHTLSRYTVSPDSPTSGSGSVPAVIVPLVETPKRPPTGKTPVARRSSSISDAWNLAGSTSEDMQDDSNVSSEESSDRSPRSSPRASIVPPLPPPPISPQTTGKQTSPRPYFVDSTCGATPRSNYPSYASFLSTQHSSADVDRLHADVMAAAKETALSYKSQPTEVQLRQEVFKACQQVSNPALVDRMITQIELYPHLATCRAAGATTTAFAADGSTPLHAAAAWGNLKAIEALLNAPGVSLWARDLQGRLPLHLAAEKHRHDVCRVLLTAMQLDSQRDLVGEDAPVDLAGLTPVGWATLRKGGRPSADITNLLYKPGDLSILPRTPFRQRAGKSPHKPHSHDSRQTTPRRSVDVAYAYSEAGGWRSSMEDRVITKCPLIAGCCLFAVLDGHGGDFCSKYLENEIPKQIISEICNIANTTDESMLDIGDLNLTHSAVEALLTTACLQADASLAAVPRMRISTNPKTGKLVVYETCGSTGCVCMITADVLAVANVGDSRAVLGCWNENGISMEAIALSTDHKFTIESERERATKAGCIVSMDEATNTVWEVYNPSLKQDNKLRMSRAFGDFYLKQNKDLPATLQAVTAAPEVIIHDRTQRDSFLVVACDGIWDVMTNQEVIDFVASELGFSDISRQPSSIDAGVIAQVTDSLLEQCIDRGSGDNMTAMIVVFHRDIDIMRTTEGVSRKLMISTPETAVTPTAVSGERIEHSTSEDSTSPIRAVKLF